MVLTLFKTIQSVLANNLPKIDSLPPPPHQIGYGPTWKRTKGPKTLETEKREGKKKKQKN